MSVSSPFIKRPIATSLLGLATVLGGALGYFCAAGVVAAAGGLPDHPGVDAASGRQPANDVDSGDRARWSASSGRSRRSRP